MTTPLTETMQLADGRVVETLPIPHSEDRIILPEKKKRNTHHWKAIAKVAQGLAAERQAMLDDLALKRECDRHAADLETSGLRKRLRVWRLASLGLALFAGLTLAALARVVVG